MSYNISCREEKNGKLLVQCDRGVYKDIMRNLSGRWNNKSGGFYLPLDKKDEIQALIQGVNEAQQNQSKPPSKNEEDHINTRFVPDEQSDSKTAPEPQVEPEVEDVVVESDHEPIIESDPEPENVIESEHEPIIESDSEPENVMESEPDPNDTYQEEDELIVESKVEPKNVKPQKNRIPPVTQKFVDEKLSSFVDSEEDELDIEFIPPKKVKAVKQEPVTSSVSTQKKKVDPKPVEQLPPKKAKQEPVHSSVSTQKPKPVEQLPPKKVKQEPEYHSLETRSKKKVDSEPVEQFKSLSKKAKQEPEYHSLETRSKKKVDTEAARKNKYDHGYESEESYRPSKKMSVPYMKTKKIHTPSPSEYSEVDYNEYDDDDDDYYEEGEDGEEEEEDGDEESDIDIDYYIPPSKRYEKERDIQRDHKDRYREYERDTRKRDFIRDRLKERDDEREHIRRSKEEKEKLRRKVELLEMKKAKKYGKTVEEIRAERKQTSMRFQDLITRVLQLENRVADLESRRSRK